MGRIKQMAPSHAKFTATSLAWKERKDTNTSFDKIKPEGAMAPIVETGGDRVTFRDLSSAPANCRSSSRSGDPIDAGGDCFRASCLIAAAFVVERSSQSLCPRNMVYVSSRQAVSGQFCQLSARKLCSPSMERSNAQKCLLRITFIPLRANPVFFKGKYTIIIRLPQEG